MASLGQRMAGAMKGDVKTFQEIEADPTAIGQAVTVILIAGVASLIGNLFRLGFFFGLMNLVITVITYAIWSLVIVLIGTKVMPEPATKADFAEGFRVIGFTAAPGVFNIFAIVPFLGPVISFFIGIWMIVIGVIAVKEVLDYSNIGRAIIVCIIAAIICWVVSVVLLTPLLIGSAVVGSIGR